MKFSLFKWTLTAGLLATGFSNPIQLHARGTTTVGIRHMEKPEADAIKAAGNKLVSDPAKSNKGVGELGIGIYVSVDTFEFMFGSWHVALELDEGKWDGVKKVWIPEKAKVDGEDLQLNGNEENIRKFVRSHGGDPDKTVRMRVDDEKQYPLPPGLVNGNPLGITAKPVQGMEALKMITLNMLDWDNIINAKQKEEEQDEDDDDIDWSDGGDD